MVKALELLKQIEIAYKNAPGRHNQLEHDPHKGSTTVARDVRDALRSAGLDPNIIPEEHYKLITGISNQEAEEYPNWINPKTGNKVVAYADVDTGIIHIDTKEKLDGRLLVHEIGHLVALRGELDPDSNEKLASGYDRFLAKYEKEPDRYWADKMAKDYGIDGHTAARGDREFEAEVYVASVLGWESHRRNLAKLLKVKDISTLFSGIELRKDLK